MLWRTIEVLKDNKWMPIGRGDIKVGDTFRMFEPSGEIVIDPIGHTEWVAMSDSIPTEPSGNFMIRTNNSMMHGGKKF